jgi:hypothetical protein
LTSVALTTPGVTVSCVITNTRKGLAKVVKTVNGAVPGLNDPPFSFDIRTGATPVSATTPSAGTILETLSTSSGKGTLSFTSSLIPGATYQMCEMIMPGYATTLGPALFAIPDPNGTNPAWMCINFTVQAGQTLTFAVNNTIPTTNGGASTIGFWKNWSSCTGGGQKPILDETLFTSQSLTPSPYGPGITLGNLTLMDGSSNKDVASDCQAAVNLLGKYTIDGKTKVASDPAFNLASQLLAAILNVDAGAKISPNDSFAISEAEILLANHNFTGVTSYTAFSGSEANLANSLAGLLDTYNNNGLEPAAVPPLITSASSATFIHGTAMNFAVTGIGVSAPAIAKAGALPAGFSFIPGTSSGTLKYTGDASPAKSTVTFTATNSAGTFTQSFTITVK